MTNLDPRRVAHDALVGFARDRVSRVGDQLSASGLQGRDLALGREIAYGVMRRRRLLDFTLSAWMPRGLPRDVATRVALRIGAYELCYLRTPSHAAVNEAVGLVAVERRPLVNAVLRRVADSVAERPVFDQRDVAVGPGYTLELNADLPTDPAERLAILHSLPDFLVQGWVDRLGGENAESVCIASTATPPLHLRATERAGAALAERCAAEGIECEPTDDPLVLRWSGGSSPLASKAFRDGLFVAQDPTSIAAGRAINAQRGENVVDYCAAPGTKSTQLAEAVGDEGVVWAFDKSASRRRKIGDNIERLGLRQIKTVERASELPRDADRVLADVPCSNSGVLGRRVEVRERIDAVAVRELARLQQQIATDAAALVRPGGVFVYATCSIEPQENSAWRPLLEQGFELEEERETLPVAGECDGGYFARLRRT